MRGKKTGGTGSQRRKRDHPDYRVIKIGLNTEKSPGDLKILHIPQIPLKNEQLTLM